MEPNDTSLSLALVKNRQSPIYRRITISNHPGAEVNKILGMNALIIEGLPDFRKGKCVRNVHQEVTQL